MALGNRAFNAWLTFLRSLSPSPSQMLKIFSSPCWRIGIRTSTFCWPKEKKKEKKIAILNYVEHTKQQFCNITFFVLCHCTNNDTKQRREWNRIGKHCLYWVNYMRMTVFPNISSIPLHFSSFSYMWSSTIWI